VNHTYSRPYGSQEYVRVDRRPAELLLEEPVDVARGLCSNLFEATVGRRFDPFKAD